MPTSQRSDGATSGIGRRRAVARRKGTESYRERRREIARVAAEVFNKQGYRGTSLSAVADALGTDRASLYYYIGSKEELFDEVVREVAEKNVANAEAIRDMDLPAPEKLAHLIRSLMVLYADNYPLLYIHMRENLDHVGGERSVWSKYMKVMNKRYEEAVIDVVQAGMDDRSFRPIASARVIAFGVIGMVGWTNRWFRPDRSPEDGDTIGAAYAHLILAGLKAANGETIASSEAYNSKAAAQNGIRSVKTNAPAAGVEDQT